MAWPSCLLRPAATHFVHSLESFLSYKYALEVLHESHRPCHCSRGIYCSLCSVCPSSVRKLLKALRNNWELTPRTGRKGVNAPSVPIQTPNPEQIPVAQPQPRPYSALMSSNMEEPFQRPKRPVNIDETPPDEPIPIDRWRYAPRPAPGTLRHGPIDPGGVTLEPWQAVSSTV
jgi:hypothetical protein